MDHRRLIKFGTSSHVISLPNEWLKKNKLNKGDIIYLEENGNNELVLTGEKKSEREDSAKEIIITIENKPFSRLKRELVSAYLNDYRIVKIKGKTLYNIAGDLKKNIQDLMGFEIIDENSESITVKDLLSLKEISLKDLVKRMDLITRAMLSDLASWNQSVHIDNIYDRDTGVNRLYYAALRTIRRGFDDPEFRKHLQLRNNVDLLKLWHTIHHIENIADEVKFIVEILIQKKIKQSQMREILDLAKEIESFYIETMKGYYLDEIERAYSLSTKKDELIKMANVLESRSIEASPAYERLKNLIQNVHKIGRRIYS